MNGFENIVENYEKLKDDFCSNFDGIINTDVALKLQTGSFYAEYPGWNFYSIVWFDAVSMEYVAEIKQYRSYMGQERGDTPQKLKENVCEKYGYQ